MDSPDRRHGPVVVGIVDDQSSVLLYALGEAARLHTTVRVVHCYAGLAGDAYFAQESPDPLHAAGAAVLTRARAVVQDVEHAVHVEYVLLRGDPGTGLLDEAERAQVVVLGADDAGWLEWMLGGDVSGHLALAAPCPVVVVPRALRMEAPVTGVVVTLDGDTSADGPLRYGFEQAGRRDERLHVLHAAPVATTEADVASLTARVHHDVARWGALMPSVSVQVGLASGDAVEACLAATSNASLLVIGRPHGEARSFALARPVAVLVLRKARCPVVIVPADYGPRVSR
jgi:nucleotide-binding universal stress UspA family protein